MGVKGTVAPHVTPSVFKILRRIKIEYKKLFLLESFKVLMNCQRKKEYVANAINV